MKNLSVIWVLVIGLVSVLWRVLAYYFRFGEWNPHAAWMDYLAFFAAGVLGGLLGLIGMAVFLLILWALFMWIGSLVRKHVLKEKSPPASLSLT